MFDRKPFRGVPVGGLYRFWSGQLANGEIAWVSYVEPDAGEFWRADMGPVLAPFRNRMEALAAEREWLETTTGFDTARQRARHSEFEWQPSIPRRFR